MEIHEYQIKALLKKNGLPVLEGGIAYTPQEAEKTAQKMSCSDFIIKAQIFSNHRTQGYFQDAPTSSENGLKRAKNAQEVGEVTANMLGRSLIMPDSPHVAHRIQKVYIEEFSPFEHSFSLSFFIDRQIQGIVCAAKTAQGKLLRFELNNRKITATTIHRIISAVQFPKDQTPRLNDLIRQLHRFFITYDALAFEIDPIILTHRNDLKILDARIIFDSDSLFRYPDIAALVEVKPGLEREAQAHMNNFRYIRLKGNIACLVNGAGLGLATIDAVHDGGGAVSCLLDVGTEPSKEAVSKAFKLALSEPDIDGILVNIFGGITRCDIIAQGLISASKEISVGMPIVVRMDGTNALIGMRMLFESHLPFIVVRDMNEAVTTVITKTREIS